MSKLTVKATFERWVDDRLDELGKNHEDLGRALKTSGIWVTRLIRKPQTPTPEQMVIFAQVLEIQDWYTILWQGWDMATETALAKDINQLLHAEGYTLDRVVNAAA